MRIWGSEIVIQNFFNVVLTVTIAFKWESQKILWMTIRVNFWISNEWMMIKIRVYEHLISFKWEGQTIGFKLGEFFNLKWMDDD